MDVDALEEALNAAVVCCILAAAGPQRSRVLANLYKDERVSQMHVFTFLEKVFFERILQPDEVRHRPPLPPTARACVHSRSAEPFCSSRHHIPRPCSLAILFAWVHPNPKPSIHVVYSANRLTPLCHACDHCLSSLLHATAMWTCPTQGLRSLRNGCSLLWTLV